jgi:UDP-glucose:glycoprotein glucosyltransferase
MFPFDHVYNPQHTTKQGAVLAVLYGSPGLECFGPLHAALKDMADSKTTTYVVYVWRPLLLQQCEVS